MPNLPAESSVTNIEKVARKTDLEEHSMFQHRPKEEQKLNVAYCISIGAQRDA